MHVRIRDVATNTTLFDNGDMRNRQGESLEQRWATKRAAHVSDPTDPLRSFWFGPEGPAFPSGEGSHGFTFMAGLMITEDVPPIAGSCWRCGFIANGGS